MHEHGPIPRFCSRSHRQRAYEARLQARRLVGAAAVVDAAKLSRYLGGIDVATYNNLAKSALAAVDTAEMTAAVVDAAKLSRYLGGIDVATYTRLARTALDRIASEKFATSLAGVGVIEEVLTEEIFGYQLDVLTAAAEDLELTPELVTAALAGVVLLVVVCFLLPAVVAAAASAIVSTAEAAVFMMELVSTVCAHNPALNGALIVFGLLSAANPKKDEE